MTGPALIADLRRRRDLMASLAEHIGELERRTEDPTRKAKLKRERERAEADAAELARTVAEAETTMRELATT